MPNTDPLLTYEEFRKQMNNFHLFFGPRGTEDDFEGKSMGDMYRDRQVFVACRRAHPKKFAQRVRRLMRDYDQRNTERYRRRMYRMYQWMHPYAKDNYELFG